MVIHSKKNFGEFLKNCRKANFLQILLDFIQQLVEEIP